VAAVQELKHIQKRPHEVSSCVRSVPATQELVFPQKLRNIKIYCISTELFSRFLNPRILGEFVSVPFWVWFLLMTDILIMMSKHDTYVGRCTHRMDRYITSR
jgi:hypothetical protein